MKRARVSVCADLSRWLRDLAAHAHLRCGGCLAACMGMLSRASGLGDAVRRYEEMMESFMIKVAFPMYGICFNQDLAKDSALAQQIRAGVGWFNGILASRPVGPFFLGRLLSMFEIMTAPFFNIFRHTLLHWRGLDIMQPYEGEPLGAWMRAVDATPSFQFIQRDAEYYNRAYVIACELPRVVNETAPVDFDAAAGAGSAPVCVR